MSLPIIGELRSLHQKQGGIIDAASQYKKRLPFNVIVSILQNA